MNSRIGGDRVHTGRDGWRTNQLHLPVRGSGDGGAYSTVGDLACFLARALRATDRSAAT